MEWWRSIADGGALENEDIFEASVLCLGNVGGYGGMKFLG